MHKLVWEKVNPNLVDHIRSVYELSGFGALPVLYTGVTPNVVVEFVDDNLNEVLDGAAASSLELNLRETL